MRFYPGSLAHLLAKLRSRAAPRRAAAIAKWFPVLCSIVRYRCTVLWCGCALASCYYPDLNWYKSILGYGDLGLSEKTPLVKRWQVWLVGQSVFDMPLRGLPPYSHVGPMWPINPLVEKSLVESEYCKLAVFTLNFGAGAASCNR